MKRASTYTILPLLLLLSHSAVTAQDPGNPDVDLATCVPVGTESQFEITLINMGSEDTNPRYIEALQKAAERWKKIIVNDLPGFPAGRIQDWFAGAFNRPYAGAVDDVVIGYDLSSTIDGVGGTLGQAGAIFTRTRRGVSISTISGQMQFDVADLQRMPDDDFKAVALHEMGHVLGLVSVNRACSSSCNPNNSRQQGIYECPLARRIYGEWAPGNLFLENRGGIGTACGHWEEDSFRTRASSELMTGFFEANLFQPISRVTVAALDEIGGYEVDYCGADIWPADESTIKRYEIFVTQSNMNVTTMMGEAPIIRGMDETGQEVPLGGDLSGAGRILRALSVAVTLIGLLVG